MRSFPAGIPKKLYSYAGILFLVTLFLRIVLAGYHNSNFGGIESNVIYGIQRILLSQPLYQDPAANTYAIMQYSPVYYYFTASVAKLIGIHALNVQAIYTLCRILALTFNLLTIIIAALIFRKWSFSWSKSLIFASPLLIILTEHYYTRGDSMHLFFFVAAICSYILYSRKGWLPYIILAALLSAICIMVKQSGVLAVGIIGFHLLFIQQKFLATVLYTVTTLTATYAVAAFCINGAWLTFYQNAYLGLKNGIDLSFLYNIFISQFYYEIIPCYFLCGILVYLAIKKITDTTFRLLATGAILSWIFAVITGLKIGSSNNYFIEFLVFIILSLPFLLENINSKKILLTLFGKHLTIHFFAAACLFILVTSKTLGLITTIYIDKRIKDEHIEYTNEKLLYNYFQNDLHIKAGEHILFTERNFLDNIFIPYAIMPTKDVVSETYLCDHSTFNYSAFISGMNNGLINYVVTDQKKKDMNRWNKEIPFMLLDNSKFKLLTDTLGYSIYVFAPNDRSINKS